MINVEIFEDLQKKINADMQKCVDIFQLKIKKIHTGRMSIGILDDIQVDYYQSKVPVYQLANIIVENFKTLLIVVFDRKIVKSVEKAILTSNLGLIPVLSDNTIRLTLPELTEERRKSLIKLVQVEVEKSKVSVRNIRKIFNNKIKNLLKDKKINKDDEHHIQIKIQNATNFWIKKIDVIYSNKELELMKF